MRNRKEQFAEGSYVHVYNRGVRKMPIYRQKSDLWRMWFNLFYLNSEHVPENWSRELDEIGSASMKNFLWPSHWGERVPLVSILAYTIKENHFHLVLRENNDGGISRFMHKFSMGYSKFLNTKYKESGSLFQGRYRSKVVEDDNYLQYVLAYVMVKNQMEMLDGGLVGAVENFEKAWNNSIKYPFSSLADFSGERTTPIIDSKVLSEIIESPVSFKEFSKDCLMGMKLEEDEFSLL